MSEDICSLCKRGHIVYVREYSGERLCPRCFIRTFERRVARTIARYGMLRHDDRIAVAVSGGKDSLALLKVLFKIESRFPMSILVAVTVDEGIPVYRDEAVEHAREFVNKLGIEWVCVRFKDVFGIDLHEVVDSKEFELSGLQPCTVCGMLRRRALEVAAKDAGATVIATAHTLDDVVQTYMMNLMRGDLGRQPFGVRAESGGFLPRVAPFKLTPEREVVMYAYLNGVPFQSHICPYARTSMRDMIRRFLCEYEDRYPGTLFTMLRSFEKLTVSSEVELRACVRCGTLTARRVCRACEVLQMLGIDALQTCKD